MSYSYAEYRKSVFTEDGQVMFLKIRDQAHALLKSSGAVTSGALMRSVTGDSWSMLACIDRLVELGDLREVTGQNVRGQDRVFVGRTEY